MNLFFNPQSLDYLPKAVLHSKMVDEDIVWVNTNPQFMFAPEWDDGATARNCGFVDVNDIGGKQRK